jgi:hypothetical protein
MRLGVSMMVMWTLPCKTMTLKISRMSVMGLVLWTGSACCMRVVVDGRECGDVAVSSLRCLPRQFVWFGG